MNNSNATTIRRNILINKTLDKRVTEKAKRIGLSYGEFVRHTLANEVSKPVATSDDWGVMPKEVQQSYYEEAMKTLELEKQGKIKSYASAIDLINSLDEETDS